MSASYRRLNDDRMDVGTIECFPQATEAVGLVVAADVTLGSYDGEFS